MKQGSSNVAPVSDIEDTTYGVPIVEASIVSSIASDLSVMEYSKNDEELAALRRIREVCLAIIAFY